jgi:2-phospho-L-lactate guanylyltransferase
MPLVRALDIEQILAQVASDAKAPYALLVPSHDRLGTNALFLAPPDVIALRFGHDSFTFHMSQVAAQGLPVRFIENEHIALDIDEPKDLRRFLDYNYLGGEATHVARRLLEEQTDAASRCLGGA